MAYYADVKKSYLASESHTCLSRQRETRVLHLPPFRFPPMVYNLQETAQGLPLPPQARCLVGLYGSQSGPLADQSENARFLVGCQSVTPNGSQVHLVTLEEGYSCQSFHLRSQSFIHPDGEVVGLTVLPAAPLLFVSVYSSISESKTELSSGARIWHLPPPLPQSLSPMDSEGKKETNFADRPPEQLEFVSSLPCNDFSSIKKVAAHPSETCSDLVCALGSPLPGTQHFLGGRTVSSTSSFIAILKAASGDYAVNSCSQLRLPAGVDEVAGGSITSPVNAVRWSPHRNASTVGVAFDSGVLGIDTRCMQPCFWLGDVHWPCVRDIDFNPNLDHILATGGDDGCLSVWDLRSIQKASTTSHGNFSFRDFSSGAVGLKPLVTVPAHSHWIWTVRYHPTRDQLLLSASSDSCVCLYGLPSFSSETRDLSKTVVTKAVSGGSSPAESEISLEGLEDGVLARLEQQQESIYAVDWSPVDPWTFAFVNYDGHFLVNQVPDKVKLGILLQRDDDDDEVEGEDEAAKDFDKV
ncbi:EARP and GARP complex-interacting protein 1 [Taenia crassiceps]|uniref:EARP and GARP complex-interacting protein 1 n=1 Tax=Taenia crassiceps TaxID=6207 RepID=A0ABR4Q6N6_9CEST